MELSLSEAARLLGKSERQVRYLIRSGGLPAKKADGRWRIQRADLPLSEGQQRAAQVKAERAVEIALEVLQPAADSGGERRRRYSVEELRAYREGAPLYRDFLSAAGAAHPAVEFLREALMLLACGCHEFQGREKAAFYSRAREQASRAVMALLLDGAETYREIVARCETAVLPALGGLIRQAEQRGRSR